MGEHESKHKSKKASKAKPLKAFKQCGGVEWEGGTCCTHGCACIKETKYYSGCHTPLQLGHCDPDSAGEEADAAKLRVEEAKHDLKVAETELKEAEDSLSDSTKASEEAEVAAQHAIKNGLEKRKEKEGADEKFGKKVKELEEAADKDIEHVKKSALEKKTKKVNAAKEKKDKVEEPATVEKEAAAKKAKEAQGKVETAQHALNLTLQGFKELKQEIDNYKKSEKMRKSVKCGGAYADCTKTWCCELGCECQGNQYYGQCKGINGKVGWCDAKGAGKFQAKRMTKFSKQDEAQKAASEKLEDASKTADELEKKAAEIETDADKKIASARKEEKETIQAASKEMEEAISAAKEKWEKKLAPARTEFHDKVNQVKLAAAKAGTARVKAVKLAKKKKMAKESAEKNLHEKKRKAEDAKAAVGDKREALEIWERAAKGERCDASSSLVVRKK